jgi:hypothetical protein
MGMSGDFLSRLFSCNHQFSWPRRTDNGDYYQVCVHCGSEYRYDWTKMRRVAPVDREETTSAPETKTSIRRCGKKVAWTPRERRLRHQVTVQFRVVGSRTWNEGTTENISRSGVLFRSENSFAEGSNLEVMFEMPKELTGNEPAQVICKGTVARVTNGPNSAKQPVSYLIACSVADYEFMKAKASDLATRKIIEINKRERLG